MTLTLERDLEEQLREFPEVRENLPGLLDRLVREQIALEKWRQNRYDPEKRQKAKRLIREAQDSEMSREEAGELLEDSIKKIAPYFEEQND